MPAISQRPTEALPKPRRNSGKDVSLGADKPWTYRRAGVCTDRADALVERIKILAGSACRKEMRHGIGGFAAVSDLPTGYRKPRLVASTDGVGTKVLLGRQHGRLQGLGIDLVAMCVNDLVAVGGEPLMFLDYYATGRLDVDQGEQLIAGIAEGCRQANAALAGGETAEMPGLYRDGDFDLAGFCVGIVEAGKEIDGSGVTVGDVVIGLASSGVHANGFSLVRKILETTGDGNVEIEGRPLIEKLLEPTRIYVRPLLTLSRRFSTSLRALAHITGGGLTGNLPRVLPLDCSASIDLSSWPLPAIFRFLQEQGQLSQEELLKTFNCGIGMALVIAEDRADEAKEQLREMGETAYQIGRIESGAGGARVRYC